MKNQSTLFDNTRTSGMTNRLFLLVFVVVLVISALFYLSNSDNGSVYNDSISPEVFYLEDSQGTMTLEEIQSMDPSEWSSVPRLGFGKSRAVCWFTINLSKLNRAESQDWYLSISNPTVEQVELYLPVKDTEQIASFQVYRSGWGYGDTRQDEDYVYPVFQLPKQLNLEAVAYLRLSSANTQNYTVRLKTEHEFLRSSMQNVLLVAFLFGILAAMAANSFFNYLSFRDPTYLYYIVYVVFMIAYQGALLGTYRLVLGNIAEVLVANVLIIGVFMLAALILFFQSFLDTKNNFPIAHKLLQLAMLGLCIVLVLDVTDFSRVSSRLSLYVANYIGYLIFITNLLAVRRGFRQARYFLASWSVMLVGLGLFTARVNGWIPNNDFTLSIVLLSSSLESILLSAALGERIQTLRAEKETALSLFHQAEVKVSSSETAFLQAQIKPHFLYNALNVIAALCRIDAERARDLVLDLSSYLHHSFDFRNLRQFISFQEELEFVQAYLRIEQSRFQGELLVDFELDQLEDFMLPPLVLQPLVENAIRHGIRKSKKTGRVVIRGQKLEDQNQYLIEVEDDGIGMDEDCIQKALSDDNTEDGGVGLFNINRRLKLFYGTSLRIQSELGKGTTVSILLPLRKEEQR